MKAHELPSGSTPGESEWEHGALTDRQYNVAIRMAQGKSIDQIATELGIKYGTTASRIESIKWKWYPKRDRGIVTYYPTFQDLAAELRRALDSGELILQNEVLPVDPGPGKGHLELGYRAAGLLLDGSSHEEIARKLGQTVEKISQAIDDFLRELKRHRTVHPQTISTFRPTVREKRPTPRPRPTKNPADREIGLRIRALRRRKNLSQNDMGGIHSQCTISNIELGLRPLTEDWASKIAAKLEVPVQELYHGGPAVEEILRLPEPDSPRIRHYKPMTARPQPVVVKTSKVLPLTSSGYTPLQLRMMVLLSRGWTMLEIAKFFGMRKVGALATARFWVIRRLDLHFQSGQQFAEWIRKAIEVGNNRLSEDLRQVDRELAGAVKPTVEIKAPVQPKPRMALIETPEKREEPKTPPLEETIFIAPRIIPRRDEVGLSQGLRLVVSAIPKANFANVVEGQWVSRYSEQLKEVKRSFIQVVRMRFLPRALRRNVFYLGRLIWDLPTAAEFLENFDQGMRQLRVSRSEVEAQLGQVLERLKKENGSKR